MLPAESTASGEAAPGCTPRLSPASLKPGRRHARCRRAAVGAAAILLALSGLRAQDAVISIDFEDGRGPGAHPALRCADGIAPAIVPGRGDQGRALCISTVTPSGYCGVDLMQAFGVSRNLILEFDHREEIEAGFEGAYLGIAFHGDDGKQVLWASDTFSKEWRHARIVVPALPATFGVPMRPGLPISRVQLYGRVKDTTPVKGATRCRLQVWFDNLRIHAPADIDLLELAKPYVCHNNPPVLDWAGPSAPGRRLQYSRSETFAAADTGTIATSDSRPFVVLTEPLAPGTWYYRVRQETELLAGWSRIQPVVIPAKTHNYSLRAIDFAALREARRPRLQRRLRPQGQPLDAAERERLLRWAQDALRQGVPEHPGPYREGDPRWPQWIDWYGQVADQVTSRTGSRLRTAGQAAILTGAPEAIDAARQLLLAACAWDPAGGSAARYGDLQAASLLQGMLWCYDACGPGLTAPDLDTVHGVLKTRILQFYGHLSPFRMNPAQNHPWRQATAVAEAALVTMGVYPEAEEWLDVACHAFAYRILPSMGFDGENQEGISYWAYGVNMLADFADLMRFMANVDLYDHPWLARTCRFPLYTTPPNGYSISFADNSHQGNASIRGPYGQELVGLLGERVKDPYALWYADRAVPGLETRPPADLPQSVFYPHIGYALFNSCLSEGLENVAVGLRCGPFYAGHQHDDNNAFVIHAYGDKLAVDGGYYDWYGSPHFRAYSIRTLAHNTLLVDGEGQVRETDGRIAAFFDSPGFGWTVGDASHPAIYAERLRRFDRRLLFLKPDIVMVHDLVETAGKPARLDWLLHAHTDQAFPCDPEAGSFLIERPAAALQGRLLAPRRARLSVSKSFDIAPQQKRASVFLPWEEVQPEWTLTASAEPASRSEFLAAMAVHRREEGRAVESVPVRAIETPAAYGCEVRLSYGRWLVLLRRQDAGDAPLAAEGLQTDGEAAAVLLAPDGTVANAFVAAGKTLAWQGTTLFSAPERRTWAMDEARQPVALSAVLSLAGRDLPMQGLRRPLPGGDVSVWWANLDLTQPRRCELEIEGWSGARPPAVRLASVSAVGVRQEVALRQGASCLTITGRGTLSRVTFRDRLDRVVDVRTIPGSITPGPHDLAIEAEVPIAESPRQGRAQEKVAASGGQAYCQIDGPVQWVEWAFGVPEAGSYGLLLRGAGDHPEVVRELRIDGKGFPAERVGVRLPGTGGWCRTTDDWAWFEVLGPTGQPALAALTAGRHVLRLEFIQGSQNVDMFLLRPSPVAGRQ